MKILICKTEAKDYVYQSGYFIFQEKPKPELARLEEDDPKVPREILDDPGLDPSLRVVKSASTQLARLEKPKKEKGQTKVPEQKWYEKVAASAVGLKDRVLRTPVVKEAIIKQAGHRTESLLLEKIAQGAGVLTKNVDRGPVVEVGGKKVEFGAEANPMDGLKLAATRYRALDFILKKYPASNSAAMGAELEAAKGQMKKWIQQI